jgi:hypothetical protein
MMIKDHEKIDNGKGYRNILATVVGRTFNSVWSRKGKVYRDKGDGWKSGAWPGYF